MQFGQPKDIAAVYLDRADPDKLSHKITVKRRVVFAIIAVVTLLGIIGSVAVLSVADDIQDYHDGYYADVIESLPPDAELAPTPLSEY